MSKEFGPGQFNTDIFNQRKFKDFCDQLDGQNLFQTIHKCGFNLETELAIIIASGSIDDALTALGKNADWNKGLKGLNILDIGCGAESTQRKGNLHGWPPLFCRMTALKGAGRVVGVDINEPLHKEKEVFKFIKGDVVPWVVGRVLDEKVGFGEKGVDVVRINQFAIDDTAPNLRESIRKNGCSFDFFEKELVKQSAIMLKEGGVLLTTYSVFKRQDNQLKIVKGSGYLPVYNI